MMQRLLLQTFESNKKGNDMSYDDYIATHNNPLERPEEHFQYYYDGDAWVVTENDIEFTIFDTESEAENWCDKNNGADKLLSYMVRRHTEKGRNDMPRRIQREMDKDAGELHFHPSDMIPDEEGEENE